MRVKRASQSGAFLTELIIAILFFSVASVICVQLFVRAHLVSRESVDVGAAVTLAQNCAEQFKAMDSEHKRQLVQVGPQAVIDYYGVVDGRMTVLEGPETADYALSARYSEDENAVYHLEIEVTRARLTGEDALFRLEVREYAGAPREVVTGSE